jgi:hypothetical protein
MALHRDDNDIPGKCYFTYSEPSDTEKLLKLFCGCQSCLILETATKNWVQVKIITVKYFTIPVKRLLGHLVLVFIYALKYSVF